MSKLESLKVFKIDKAQQQQIKAGKGIYDQDSGTMQVGGGYCTSGPCSLDCQDAIYNDDGGVIGFTDPVYDTPGPSCP